MIARKVSKKEKKMTLIQSIFNYGCSLIFEKKLSGNTNLKKNIRAESFLLCQIHTIKFVNKVIVLGKQTSAFFCNLNLVNAPK
jgi:hypothetical protein